MAQRREYHKRIAVITINNNEIINFIYIPITVLPRLLRAIAHPPLFPNLVPPVLFFGLWLCLW